MDFGSLINSAKEFIPGCIIVAVIAVIMLSYGSLFIASLVEDLVETAKLYDNMETVRKMKQIVPEYKSNNSIYEKLDKE